MTPNEPDWVGEQIDEELARRDAEIRRLREAVIAYLVAQGPCEDADEDEGYCQDDGCLYCQLARAVDERRSAGSRCG